MSEDRYGLPLGSRPPRAVEGYVAAVDAILSGNVGADEALDRALTADPDFALAHAAKARALQMRGAGAEAKIAAARASELARAVTQRERGHVEAVSLALGPDLPRALDAAREHLREFPRDALVLSLATGVYSLTGFSGRRDRNELLLGILDELAPAYGEDWWFLNVHAFACTEAGDPARGRRLVERSLSLYPRNAHAAHALAHVLYEEGDSAAGAAFVSGWLPGYARASQLHCHLSWHLALFELGRGRVEEAAKIYDDSIRPGVSLSAALGTLADSASFLWRCHLWNVGPTPLPWEDVRDFARCAFPKPSVAFADGHLVLALAAAGDPDGAAARLVDLRQLDGEGRQPAGRVVSEVGEAMTAYARGDWERTIALMGPVFEELVRIGGSRAQRDVFEQTLLSAYLHAGRDDEASRRLRRRLEGRPAVPVSSTRRPMSSR
jgi:Tfp pilus assembly protein PilF